MSNCKVTDILITDLENNPLIIHQVEEAMHSLRKNIAGDRVIIKWCGDNPSFVAELGLGVRTEANAKLYYNDINNGWTEPEEGL
jgi:hypothetical protein